MVRRIYLTIVVVIGLANMAAAATHYVAKPGTNVSGPWVGHWTTIAEVNAGTNSGDTVFFGTGIFRDASLRVISGTYSDRTTYACSSFAETNQAGQYHFAQLWGSDSLTGWTQSSGNVYRVSWTSNITYPQLFQGDSIMWRQTSLGGVDGPGKWYYSSGTIYAWAYGGGDPDNYQMEATQRNIVDLGGATSNVAQSYVTLYGFRMKYSYVRMIEMNYIASSVARDSIFIERCHLSHCAGQQGSNPGLIYSGASLSTSRFGDHMRLRACSLGYVWAISESTYQSLGDKGSGIDFYHEKHMTIDSNVFYGFFKMAAIYRKAGYSTSNCDSNTICFNRFENYEGDAVCVLGPGYGLRIYGNVMDGVERAFRYRLFNVGQNGYTKIYNNTIVNAGAVVAVADQGSDWVDQEFKYNVIYSTVPDSVRIDSYGDGSPGSQWIDIDSNMYYNPSGSIVLSIPRYTSVSQSYWQNTVHADVHSSFTTDPGFQNYNVGDFSRPHATNEMDTTYGGRRWTKYGAIQDAEVLTNPRMTLSVSDLNFLAQQGGSLPAASTFSITNVGIGTLDWSVSDNADWLDLSPTSGTSNSAIITASINTTSLAPDTYNTFITVSSSNADNSPLVISVNYTVSTGADTTPPAQIQDLDTLSGTVTKK